MRAVSQLQLHFFCNSTIYVKTPIDIDGVEVKNFILFYHRFRLDAEISELVYSDEFSKWIKEQPGFAIEFIDVLMGKNLKI
jgi:hypothetical protein